jgi:hypothetical protein
MAFPSRGGKILFGQHLGILLKISSSKALRLKLAVILSNIYAIRRFQPPTALHCLITEVLPVPFVSSANSVYYYLSVKVKKT